MNSSNWSCLCLYFVRFLVLTIISQGVIHSVSAYDGKIGDKETTGDGTHIGGSIAILPDKIMTASGYVRGKMFQSRNGRNYNGFLGIPYSNFSEMKRFQTAVPLTMPWEGIRDAMDFAPSCIQYDSISASVKGEENCLFLNIFTPMTVQNFPKLMTNSDTHAHWMTIQSETGNMTYLHMRPFWMPVIVFIHGGVGEFQEGGSSNFGTGKFFMDEDVVVVTLNYRLGPFGFLSTGDKFAMGNIGLKDQVLALEWVRQNIVAFGGDPLRVTILGEGAGAISTHYLMMSPLAQDLFQRAISLGGTSLDPGTFSSNPMEISKKFGELFRCPSTTGNMSNSIELISCLRKENPKELAEKSAKEFKRWGKDYQIPFAPCFEAAEQFLTDSIDGEPESLVFLQPLSYAEHLNSGSFNRVPWLIGANKEEGFLHAMSLVNNEKLLEELNSGWNRIAPNLFLYHDKVPTESLDSLSEEIRKFYFGDAMIGQQVKENLTHLFSDIFFLRGMRKASQSQASVGQSVYPFLFNVIRMSSVPSEINDMTNGPTHGDSLQYLFDMVNGVESKFEPGSEHENISKILIRLLTSFAKFGVPMENKVIWEPLISGIGQNPIFWNQILSSGKPMMQFDESFLVRFRFWDYIESKYGM